MKKEMIEKKLLTVLKVEAKKMGKSISWFRFAKKTKNGYKFLANKDAQWNTLEEIAKKLTKKYANLTEGEIVDILSHIVNK